MECVMQLSLLRNERAEQLALELEPAIPPCRDDIIESPECASGVRLIDAWPNWPSHVAILTGPAGSGKTHLSSVWAAGARARRIVGTELPGLDPTRFARGAVVIEHLDIALEGERPRAAQTGLFHLLNTLRESGGHLLATSRTLPSTWTLLVPDLASRLKGATHVGLSAPNEEQMRAVLYKLFADRQLTVSPAVIETVASRMERSLGRARALVTRIDRIALAERRKIDHRLVLRALNSL